MNNVYDISNDDIISKSTDLPILKPNIIDIGVEHHVYQEH